MSFASASRLACVRIAPEVLKLVSYETMRRRGFVPFDLKEGKLRVAMVHAGDLTALDDVRGLTGYDVEAFPITQEELLEVLSRHFGAAERPARAELSLRPARAGEASPESQAGALVDKLVGLAAAMRASDIHLEPQRGGFFARLRIDGVLQTLHEFPKSLQAAMTSRIKVMANLDIAEKRLPQDGQMGAREGGRDIDLRVSTLPGKYGEKVVIRLLDKSSLALGLEQLGFEPAMQSLFESLIERPHGLILVTGPTGSGKTSTLYAVLNRLKSPLKNVITLEDPIEYELLAASSNEMGVTQVQMQPKIGLTFAAGLRSALRQDPDVIMVGEIRDRETAEIAMKAAMTGHLVLSTLHTNDALSALGRLMDMGIEPYLLATTVAGILAQRLVRLLCPACKEPYAPPERALRGLFPERRDIARALLHRPKGCSVCQKTGYQGRRGIFELLLMSEELKRRLHAGERLRGDVSPEGERLGRSLRESGLELVLGGLTSVEEVARVTVE